ncbi:MAG: Ni/Fe hydrogenase subunit alpha [Thermoplasmata archaeon]
MNVEMNYITQIEGHGIINFEIVDGKPKVRMEVHEGARLFESFLRNRRADEVIAMSSRICGVCPVVHNYAAVQAVENAMGIEVSEQTKLLRRLGNVGQMLQSHALHLYVLALPEYLNADGVVDVYMRNPEAVKRALKIRNVGNLIVEVVSGRAVHPVSSVPGGFAKLPTKTELKRIVKELKGVLDDCIETYNLAASIKYPELQRKTEYSAIDDGEMYPSYGGMIVSSEGVRAPAKDYRKYTNEVFRPYSHTKFSTRNGHGFFVGSIARVNLFSDRLGEKAKELAKNGPVKFPSYNPFHNLVAQALELVHYAEEGIEIASRLAKTLKEEKPQKIVKAGTGVGVVEAPRGTLFHEYTVDANGIVKEANIITPTAQNVQNIEEDLTALLTANINKPREELVRLTEALLRAYDPCFSCSTH